MRSFVTTIAVIWLSLGISSAGEIRIGVSKHDITDTESGANFQAEYIFGRRPDLIGRRYNIRPYLVASANTDGHINFAGGGLQPEIFLSPKWFAEFQAGVILHDGRIDLPPPDQPIERQHVLDTETTYGCEVLFHLAPAVGRSFGENWNIQLFWEHLSHGQILCDNGKNEGLDNYGIRVGYDF